MTDVPPEVLSVLKDWLRGIEVGTVTLGTDLTDNINYKTVKAFVDWHENTECFNIGDIILPSGCNLTTKVHVMGCSCYYSTR
jgi:hypothetical protein